MVSNIGPAGQVTGFDVLDGGGYSTVSLPGGLVFTPDSLSDGQGTGTGLTLTPNFGTRYSANFVSYTAFGVCVLGNIFGGIINNNVIDTTRGGVGILVQDGAPPYNTRANHLNIVGNSIINNAYSIRGQTIGGAIDSSYNFNSVIANNMIYPLDITA
jgi:hypothetical protein